jgi:NAD(P)H-hydrate epimerase
VLTPHPVEFDRLTHSHSSELDRLRSQIELTRQYGVALLVKGHHTVVTTEKGIFFNINGNNGMATAGSGDVLTGIITSLCAQGYDAGEASLIGVYIHGYAGDIAAGKVSMHSLIASDIINNLGNVFLKYETLKD